jgi:hypothetical protein
MIFSIIQISLVFGLFSHEFHGKNDDFMTYNDDFNDVLNKIQLQILNEKKVKSGLRAEELREKLDPEAAIISLLTIANESKTCAIEDLPRLQIQIGIMTTILKKCMPDLRSLEIKDNNKNRSTLIIEMRGPDLIDSN